MVSPYEKGNDHDVILNYFATYQSGVVFKIAANFEKKTSKYQNIRKITYTFSLGSILFEFCAVLFCILRRFEDMKHYAENLGSNVAAMIKVRQVDYPLLCLTQAGGIP